MYRINSSELFDSRYVVYRRDRDNCSTGQKLRGGVLLAIRRDIFMFERLHWRSSAEDIWVTVNQSLGRPNNINNNHICMLYLCDENKGHSYNSQP